MRFYDLDRRMKKIDLKDAAEFSSNSITKLGKGENVITDVLLRKCEALNCKLDDIEAWYQWEMPRVDDYHLKIT